MIVLEKIKEETMKFIKTIILALIVGFGIESSAQEEKPTGNPFFAKGVSQKYSEQSLKTAYVQALRTGDGASMFDANLDLNLVSDELVKNVNIYYRRAYPNAMDVLSKEKVLELVEAGEIKNAEWAGTSMKVYLVTPNGKIPTFYRAAYPNEKALYVFGYPVLSFNCGNLLFQEEGVQYVATKTTKSDTAEQGGVTVINNITVTLQNENTATSSATPTTTSASTITEQPQQVASYQPAGQYYQEPAPQYVSAQAPMQTQAPVPNQTQCVSQKRFGLAEFIGGVIVGAVGMWLFDRITGQYVQARPGYNYPTNQYQQMPVGWLPVGSPGNPSSGSGNTGGGPQNPSNGNPGGGGPVNPTNLIF